MKKWEIKVTPVYITYKETFLLELMPWKLELPSYLSYINKIMCMGVSIYWHRISSFLHLHKFNHARGGQRGREKGKWEQCWPCHSTQRTYAPEPDEIWELTRLISLVLKVLSVTLKLGTYLLYNLASKQQWIILCSNREETQPGRKTDCAGFTETQYGDYLTWCLSKRFLKVILIRQLQNQPSHYHRTPFMYKTSQPLYYSISNATPVIFLLLISAEMHIIILPKSQCYFLAANLYNVYFDTYFW